jgi:uncharacterized membrane protein YbaN (DUF454 family)
MDISDALVLIGWIGLGLGLWEIYPPLSLIVNSFLLILLGLFSAQSKSFKRQKRYGHSNKHI